MSTISRQFSLADPVPVAVVPRPLTSSTYSPSPRATVSATGFPRPFGDTGFTSRCPEALPAGAWQEEWTTPMDPNFPPAFVIAMRDRIVVQGGGQWQMLDLSGRSVARQRTGPGPVFLDAAHDRLFFVDRNHQLVAMHQRDGSQDFQLPIAFGDLFAKQFVASTGTNLVLVAVEQEGMPHRPTPPNQSAIEVIGTGTPLTRFDDGTLSSLDRDEKLLIDTTGLVAAMQNDRIVAAWPNHLLLTGIDLQVHTLFEGRFEPGFMAQDEAGRAYLILADEHGSRALWVLSETGQRMLAVPLPPELGTLFFPPIIGFDHRIHVLTHSRLISFAPSGEQLWAAPAQSRFVGATITADGNVLAADGQEVVAFGPDGTRHALVHLATPVLAPPILGSGQVLLAAEAGRLHAFRHVAH